MADFLREVDEDYRRDQMIALWKRFGPWVIGGAVAIVLATASFVWWRDHQRAERARLGDQYIAALADLANGDTAATASLAELAKSGNQGFALLAKLTQADADLKAGHHDQAAAAFEAIAQAADTPENLRGLGTLLAVTTVFDRLDAEVIRDRLTPLAVPGNPWYGLATEAIGLALIRDGRGEEARGSLELLYSDADIGPALRQRLIVYLEILGPSPVKAAGEGTGQ